MEYYLYMTNDCNMRCEYCSVLTYEDPNVYPRNPAYSVNDLVAFISGVNERNNDPIVDIYYFGGEPTLEAGNILKYMEAIDESLSGRFSVQHVLHTNGLLLKELPRNLLENLDVVVLSINSEKFDRNTSNDGYLQVISRGIRNVRRNTDCPVTARTEDADDEPIQCRC